jgi:translocation and assembly module TamB
MRLLFKVLAALAAIIIILPIALVGAIFIGLNSAAGRDIAVTEINHFAGPQIHISGLAGHFPADLKLGAVTVSDARGVYATAGNIELRWLPWQFLAHKLHVTSLTAATITVLRQPVPASPSGGGGGGGLPNLRIDLDHLAIGALHLNAAVDGEDNTLAVTGAAHLPSLTQGNVTLAADAAGGMGAYRIAAALDPKRIDTHVTIAEPPGGPIGHFAGPQIHAPLNLDLALTGPRDNAALVFAAALGDARMKGAGTLSLDSDAPKADVTFTVPELATFAAIAGQKIAGRSKIHLVASQQNNATDIMLDGDIGLTAAPGPAAKLVGPNGHLSLLLTLAGDQADIENLNISGAGFNIAANGSVARGDIQLNTHLALNNVASVSPGISGPLAEDGSIDGTAQDFSVNALLTGDISDKSIPSGPFSIAINAQHLPKAPTGTLTGSGALENAPLLLDAQFSRNTAGDTNLLINNAIWRSLNAQADVTLAAGAALPTGTAKFAVGNLADFANFSPIRLSGSVNGNFSHGQAKDFALNVTARNLVALPSLGAINAQLAAAGPVDALAIKLSAAIAKVMNAPAKIALAGALNLDARSASLAALSASWCSVDARLQGPASIETKPGIAVHHLALALNGGSVDLDGTLTPHLGVTFAAKNLPASLAALAAPSIDASGTLSVAGSLAGTPASPTGKLNLDANNIRLHRGPAASLPAANFTADIALAGKTANLNAKLGLGRDVGLAADGLVPLTSSGPISLHVTGTTDLRLLDPILAAQGSTVRGVVTPDLTITGTATAPRANGTVRLAGGSVQNVGSGLNLTDVSASLAAAGRLVTLQNLQAKAGPGQITGHGTIDLGTPDIPIDMSIDAANATPVSSDLATESVNAALTIKGAARGAMSLAGDIDLLRANINIPKSLPPSVANLPIINEGQARPPPAPPPPPIALDLTIRAKNQIFIRGDGLFAELGGKVHITGTADDPNPAGGFTLIRGNFALAGKTLQFTQGTVDFTGDGFIPTLDLEATTTTTSNTTASLIIGGTAEKPTITLSASPPLPSDEVLSQLLFGQSTSSLSPFQAASLAAALASLSGVGGSAISDPLGGVRNALGLDELSLGGSGSGPPTVNAGRYVAPGVYVGAQQSTSGQGTEATVQINLYKGLQLQTSTGTSGSGSGASSSVGLTYQFNY